MLGFWDCLETVKVSQVFRPSASGAHVAFGVSELPCWKVQLLKHWICLWTVWGRAADFPGVDQSIFVTVMCLRHRTREREPCSVLSCVSSTDWVMNPSCRGICRPPLFHMVIFLTPVQVQWRPLFCTCVCSEFKDKIIVEKLEMRIKFFWANYLWWQHLNRAWKFGLSDIPIR